MSKERECAEALRNIVGKEPFCTYVAKVTKVDDAVCTVERLFDGMVLEDVRLNTHSTKGSGIVVTPKVDSMVLITSIDGRYWFVSQCSEVEKITIDATDKIIFNGGDNKGLVKVAEMVNWMQKVYNDLAELSTLLSTSEVAGNGAPLAISFTPSTPLPSIDNFQNDKIIH